MSKNKNKKKKIEEVVLESFPCNDCGIDTLGYEYYMVHDHVWIDQAGMTGEPYEGFLCIGCLEKRIGRMLKSGDFIHWPINNVNQGYKSERLIDRLMKV